ncbi:uncharacterized protein LOC144887575 [Branchiostoma floridae x Branchiostoma japonicum]
MGAEQSTRAFTDGKNGETENPVAGAASRLTKQLTMAASMVAKDMGVKLGGGTAVVAVTEVVAGPIGMVAGALATAIVNGISDTIVPKKTEVQYTMEDIRKALSQALEKDTITKINGLLSDLKSRVEIDYANERKRGNLSDLATRERLHDRLVELNGKLDGLIGTLMENNYAKTGLVLFLLLASLRLALYQEMANVDPLNKDPKFNPAKSHYATPRTGNVAQYAKKYADHAGKWWPLVLKDRRCKIKVKDWGKDGGRIDDELTGDFQKDTKRSANLLEEEYWEKQKKKFEDKFCHPEEIIANWRRLIEVPINIPHIPDVPVVDSPAVPVKDSPAVPVKGSPGVPVKGSPAIPVKGSPAIPVKDSPAIPVKNSPAIPVKVSPSVPVKDSPAVPVKDSPSVPLKGSPDVTDGSPDGTHVDSTVQPVHHYTAWLIRFFNWLFWWFSPRGVHDQDDHNKNK